MQEMDDEENKYENRNCALWRRGLV